MSILKFILKKKGSALNRDDLSTKLIHLTRGISKIEATSRFMDIFKSKELLGSSTDIRGGFKCICFSEAPISKLAGVLAHAQDMRYAPLGVIADKKWIYSMGGRPAIYQSNSEFDLLHDSQKYRHVKFEPEHDVDYSWEREWRLKADNIALPVDSTTFIVPTRNWVNKILGDWFGAIKRASFAYMPVIGQIPGHFLVLEDLGIAFTDDFRSID